MFTNIPPRFKVCLGNFRGESIAFSLMLFFFFYLVETSDHSDIETRVRRLRDQLEIRQREVKRLYNERKRQRKAMLRAQEASLRQELQVTRIV